MKPGHRIMIDDGILEVKVTKIVGRVVEAKVINGGLVTSHKGMNFPDTTLRVDPITAKDKVDLAFSVKAGVQWIAMSFVTSPKDVARMRRMIGDQKIIVKIEKHEALKNFDAILKVADGIMIARGDLGVETAAEDVPLHQKIIIAKCRAAGKPVVVATQMLDSMIRNPRPTRAEVSDVANAVIDHTEGVMLSGETASGKYPVEAVTMMKKICLDTEASAFDDLKINPDGVRSVICDLSSTKFVQKITDHRPDPITIISLSVATLSRLKKIDAVVTVAALGSILPALNKFRPEVSIYLACSTDNEARQWNIRWGIHPFVLKGGDAIRQLQKMKRLKKGQKVALVVIRDKKSQVELTTV
ncbi:MAG: pyruvate kinase [Patescibacteria group bacterium]